LGDDPWERLESLRPPGHSGHVGVTTEDNRRFVESVAEPTATGMITKVGVKTKRSRAGWDNAYLEKVLLT
jgi:hypothetical protein